MNSARPILTLADIEAFDPGNVTTRRLCPLCGSEKPKDTSHRSLSLDAQTGKWKCFRCNAGGVLREFWSDHAASSQASFGKSTFNARGSRLKTIFSVGDNAAASTSFEPLKSDLNAIFATSDENVLSSTPSWQAKWESTIELQNTSGATYLEKRRIALPIALESQTRFHPQWSGHASVVFPLKNRIGEIVAAQARAIKGDAKLTGGPKIEGAFAAPVKMKTGRVFAPLDQNTPVIALVEAPIDALSLAVAGFPALALCGTSGPHWLHIACGLRRVALALDADEAGDKAALDLQRILTPFGAKCFRLRPEGAKDWNELLLIKGRNFLGDQLMQYLL